MKTHLPSLSILARAAALSVAFALAGCGGGDETAVANGCNDGPTVYFSAAQVRSLTVAQVKALRDEDVAAMGSNISLLSDAALSGLSPYIANKSLFCKFRVSQVRAIEREQILSLSPRQVRLLGSEQDGISQITWLTLETFTRLVSDPAQVAAITPAEYATLNSPHFTSVGSNFHYLSDAVLATMQETFKSTPFNFTSHLAAITPAQIDTLTPERLRVLGTANGSAPKLQYLTEATFRQAMLRPENVQGLTAVDAANLRDVHTAALGANIRLLTDDAMRSLRGTYIPTPVTKTSAVGGITPEQVALLSPQQVLLLASVNEGKGLGSMAELSFGALLPSQTAVLLPTHVVAVRSAQLAKLSLEAIAAMPQGTRLSFTNLQKRELNAVQADWFK